MTVNVAPVNDAPVAVADTLAATEDTAGHLRGGRSARQRHRRRRPDTLSIASVTSGTGGTAVLNADGTVTFTPNANFNGAADFTYTVSDGTDDQRAGHGRPSTSPPVNDAPVAVADTLARHRGHRRSPITAAELLGNDTDVDARHAVDRLGDQRHRRHGGPEPATAPSPSPRTPTSTAPPSFTYTVSDGTDDQRAGHRHGQRRRRSTTRRWRSPTRWRPAEDTAGHLHGGASCSATTPTSTGDTADRRLGDQRQPAARRSSTRDGTVTFTPNANFNGAAELHLHGQRRHRRPARRPRSPSTSPPVNDAPVAVADTLARHRGHRRSPITAAQLLGNDTDVDARPADRSPR